MVSLIKYCCSANHLFVRFLSASTTFNLFKSLGSSININFRVQKYYFFSILRAFLHDIYWTCKNLRIFHSFCKPNLDFSLNKIPFWLNCLTCSLIHLMLSPNAKSENFLCFAFSETWRHLAIAQPSLALLSVCTSFPR